MQTSPTAQKTPPEHPTLSFIKHFPVAWRANMHWDTSERFWQGPLTGGTQGHCSKWDDVGQTGLQSPQRAQFGAFP